MPVMSAVEGAFCRSAPWRGVARQVVLPWALGGRELAGDVLEIGAGSGAMAAGIARSHPRARLTVTDVDEAMVRAARSRLGHRPDVEVRVADVTELPFDDGSFDVVLSFLMLHHVVDWQSAITEALRVLRPGGMLLGYDLVDSRIARAVHRLDGSPVRLVGVEELREALGRAAGRDREQPDVTVTTAAGGLLMRFGARRPGLPGGAVTRPGPA